MSGFPVSSGRIVHPGSGTFDPDTTVCGIDRYTKEEINALRSLGLPAPKEPMSLPTPADQKPAVVRCFEGYVPTEKPIVLKDRYFPDPGRAPGIVPCTLPFHHYRHVNAEFKGSCEQVLTKTGIDANKPQNILLIGSGYLFEGPVYHELFKSFKLHAVDLDSDHIRVSQKLYVHDKRFSFQQADATVPSNIDGDKYSIVILRHAEMDYPETWPRLMATALLKVSEGGCVFMTFYTEWEACIAIKVAFTKLGIKFSDIEFFDGGRVLANVLNEGFLAAPGMEVPVYDKKVLIIKKPA